MAMTEPDLSTRETKRQSALALVQLDKDHHPVIKVGGETIVDPKWGRVCSTCDEPKPWTAYGADSSHSSGHRSRCLECCRRIDQERRDAHRAELEAARKAAEAAVTAEVEEADKEVVARIDALEALAELYPTKFTSLLYSAKVRHGLVDLRPGSPRYSDYKTPDYSVRHRSWASTRS